jgi:acid phosphatase type 7
MKRDKTNRRRRVTCFILAALFFFVVFSVPAPGASGGSDCIVIYGDTRSNHDIHRKIVGQIMKFKPQAVFVTGDLVGSGDKKEDWDLFNEIAGPLMRSTEFYPMLGNHERNSPLYFNNFTLPGNKRWYAVEKNGIRFVVLDSNWKIGPGSEQRQWLETKLRDIPKKVRFVIVLFHHPPFSSGPHQDEKRLQSKLVPVLESYGVDAAFTGHAHVYERLSRNDIYYVITGGGGAPLHSRMDKNPYSQVFWSVHNFCVLNVVENDLVVQAYDSDMNRIDSFRIKSRR